MTNDEFILGLIEIGVQKGYGVPDKNTNTEFVDRGMFTLLYGGDIVLLEKDNRPSFSRKNTDTEHFFTILPRRIYTKRGEKYFISKETYEKAFEYFFEIGDLDKLKKKLEKDIRKEKLESIEENES